MSDLVRHTGAPSSALATLDDATINRFGRVANWLAKSGYFADAQGGVQAFTKLMFGYDLGLSVTASMTDIHIIDGKPSLSANLQAVKIKQWRGEEGERYRYKITDHDAEKCVIDFSFKDEDGEWSEVGTSSFTMEDAKTAGLAHKDNWKKHPKNMLFARALSNGCAFFCPEVMEGVRVYNEGDDLGGQSAHAGDFEARAEALAAEDGQASEEPADAVVVEEEAVVVEEAPTGGPDELPPLDHPVDASDLAEEPVAASDVTSQADIDAIKAAFPGAEEVPAETLAADPGPEQPAAPAASTEDLENLVREKLTGVGEDPAIIEARIRGTKGKAELLNGLLSYAEQKAAAAK